MQVQNEYFSVSLGDLKDCLFEARGITFFVLLTKLILRLKVSIFLLRIDALGGI